jgi:putative membrane protein insertion efficiency factor
MKIFINSAVKSFEVFKKILVFVGVMPVYFYRLVIKPFVPRSCKFYPTCSVYTIEAIKRFGIVYGWGLGIRRIIRCNPFNKRESGYDPVPYKHAGGAKWVI